MIIEHLIVSPGHNYFGHHGQPADEHPTVAVERIACVAGRGIVGDRFFDYRADYRGQITFFAMETLELLGERLGQAPLSPAVVRRNVFTRGQDLLALIGSEFEVQGVRFRGTEECRPCYWMNGAIAPGAEDLMRGRGGLRAQILSDGLLRVTAGSSAT